MGSKCSKIGIKGVILPSKRVPTEDTKTVHIASKSQKRGSLGSARLGRPEEKTADTVKSPENAFGTSSKQKPIIGELTNHDTSGNNDNLNDTYPIVTPTTAEKSQYKRLFQYKKGPLIGKGTHANVYECLDLNSGELLAVKSFKIKGDSFRVSSYIEALKKEVMVLRSLGHRNIVKYHSCEISEDKENNCSVADIILEYVSGGSIRKLLDKFGKLEEKVIGTYTRQILEGLTYLHLNDLVHRNLKGSNILIDTTGTIKLTDFGCSGRPERFSEENPQDQPKAISKSSTFFSAPEVIMRKSQGKPADIWSVGCVIIEMLTGNPSKDLNMDDFVRDISTGGHPPIPEGLSEHCKDFLLRTFKFHPEDRPSPLDLLEHPFIREENQDTSYLEAESVQTYQTFQSGQKVLDLGGGGVAVVADPRADRKYLDLKSNNFTRKQIGTNVSMSNINLGRVSTADFAQHTAQNSIGGGIMEPRNSLGYLQRVREAQYEDEQSPEPDFQNQFYKFGKMSKQRSGNSNDGENLTKEEKRRRIEAEMEKELMKVSTGNLGNTEEDQDVDRTNVYNIENSDKKPEPYKKSIMPAPIKNSLFNNDEEHSKKSTNELIYSAVNMNISEYKAPVGQAQGQPAYLGYTGTMWNSQHMELKNSALSKNYEQTQEDRSSEVYDGILFRGSTGNMVEKQDVSMQNSETDTAKKERIRRQFEEQMEVSLQRVNSERYNAERDEHSENSETGGEHKFRGSGIKKNYEEENYSQVLPRFSAEDRRDTWKNEESSSYIDKTQGKKFEEDIIGVFRGVWDGQAEGMDNILRRNSNQLFDSERRTPELHILKYNPEDSKSTQEPFSGLAGQRASPEVLEYEKGKEQDIIDQENLGIINEAEELKEDSWQQGTFRKRPSSQETF